jgi:hypothetical protein
LVSSPQVVWAHPSLVQFKIFGVSRPYDAEPASKQFRSSDIRRAAFGGEVPGQRGSVLDDKRSHYRCSATQGRRSPMWQQRGREDHTKKQNGVSIPVSVRAGGLCGWVCELADVAALRGAMPADALGGIVSERDAAAAKPWPAAAMSTRRRGGSTTLDTVAGRGSMGADAHRTVDGQDDDEYPQRCNRKHLEACFVRCTALHVGPERRRTRLVL